MPHPPAPVSTKSQLAARATVAAAALALAAVAALHVLRPELDPSWHMLSEYALGPYDWIMTLCFAAFAAGSASLFVALLARVPTLAGRIGLAFLLAAALGLALAALFPTDPLATQPQAASFSGRMHGVAALIGMPSEILAVLLLSLALRKQAAWRALPLLALATVVWLSLGTMIASLMVAAQRQSMDGPGIVGWANRLLMIGYSAWLMLAAWPVRRAPAG